MVILCVFLIFLYIMERIYWKLNTNKIIQKQLQNINYLLAPLQIGYVKCYVCGKQHCNKTWGEKQIQTIQCTACGHIILPLIKKGDKVKIVETDTIGEVVNYLPSQWFIQIKTDNEMIKLENKAIEIIN